MFEWNHYQNDTFSVSNHGKQIKTFMFIKADPNSGTSDELLSEIVKYCRAIDKPLLKKKKDTKNGIILFKCKDIMFPFQVKARRQSITTIWKMTQDSLSLAHLWELTFGNRNVTRCPVLSMAYPQIGLNIPLTKKSSGMKHDVLAFEKDNAIFWCLFSFSLRVVNCCTVFDNLTEQLIRSSIVWISLNKHEGIYLPAMVAD